MIPHLKVIGYFLMEGLQHIPTGVLASQITPVVMRIVWISIIRLLDFGTIHIVAIVGKQFIIPQLPSLD